MVQHKSALQRTVYVGIYCLLTLVALVCILPLINVLALSFSSNDAIQADKVTFWPVEFSTKAYHFVAQKKAFLLSIWVSIQRVGLGLLINMVLTVLVAYPLSKESSHFRLRTLYAWVFVFTMLFSGGLVPTYLIVKNLGMLDTLWALVLPGAVPIFNVILMLNFFRALPKELMEASFIDGCGHWKLLWKVILPLSTPSIATVGLFTIVGHWNEWFAGIIYMNDSIHYPLASYLQTIVVNLDISKIANIDDATYLQSLNDRAVRAAQIFLGALPIFCVYPFLQRYFMSGIVLGSVKE
ncbi:carbohydrate ABC transporter permease [Paenibacillus sacheonensis]|uniref:ABC transporter permease subunit n=1 Tax=Paenibacillus sacheonensis TaxID=742054 RepID=A0A7X5C4X8_9BACL|nr:carbohydrate ABC transporter permease [Paenibacillus sacheonensis]MBM7567261.1 putative aldouronate transport system permease protein [Paenibacillus sacheonensis]NBC72844.1 ABC transporter permease subunit [Paenibacillus sacheonensis]